MKDYKFSGHETFQCRHFWLKKGYDFVMKEGDFKSNDALIDLGVGKNMISSIDHWLKVFGLTDSESGELTEFAHKIFGEDSFDPYLEDNGSLYLLHFNILSNSQLASIYEMVFGEFRKTRISSEFTSNQLYEFITRKLNIEGVAYSENTIRNDIRVFLRIYQTSSKRGSKSIEDDFASVLIGLNFIDPVQDVFIEGEQVYKLQYDEQENLNELILLYTIIDTFNNRTSIGFEEIQLEVSDKFLCNREGTESKLNALTENGYVVYKQDAGRKEVQLKSNIDKWDVLKKYYGRV
jgi:hypothetical protein